MRGATIVIDPAIGDPAERVPVFVRSRGAEVGARVERGPLTALLVGYWLDLSELVFDGDAGSTEPNDASRRWGGEFSLFWRPAEWLTIDGTFALTRACFRGVAAGQDRISGATPRVFGGGVSASLGKGVTATMRVRHFGSVPLIEDGTQKLQATTLANFGVYWETGPFRVAADILNLFDARDPDISYFYASRLPSEPGDGVEDRHIHPVKPLQAGVSVRLSV